MFRDGAVGVAFAVRWDHSMKNNVGKCLFVGLFLVLSPALAFAHHISGTVYCDVDGDSVIDKLPVAARGRIT